MKRLSASDPASIQAAVETLRAGGVIVYPTDTAYGLGADATNPAAVEKIFTIKARVANNPIPVIVADVEQAKRYVTFTEGGERLARAYWPGALTIVLHAVDETLSHIIKGGDTIGVRVPANEWCQRVAKVLERPITSTSANRSGVPPFYEMDGIVADLAEAGDFVDLWIDGGTLPGGPVSTVVVLAEDGGVAIKREGAISGEDIKSVLK